jgi:hypothetical protein
LFVWWGFLLASTRKEGQDRELPNSGNKSNGSAETSPKKQKHRKSL